MAPAAENILVKVHEAMGENTLDPVVWKNDVQNGCFEHCDGWPEALWKRKQDIMVVALSMMEHKPTNPIDEEELLERARQYAKIDLEIGKVCRQECPTGGFGLFEDDEDMEDENGNPIVRSCPIKERLAQVAVQYSLVESQ